MILTFWNKFSLTLYMYKEKKKKNYNNYLMALTKNIFRKVWGTNNVFYTVVIFLSSKTFKNSLIFAFLCFRVR